MPPTKPTISCSNIGVNAITSSWKMKSDNVAVAIFCETIMVQGNKEIPVQVSIVDNYFKCRLHKYIRIPHDASIENFRIFNHGLPLNLLRTKGHDFEAIREEIICLVSGKVVVGYNLAFVLRVLNVDGWVPPHMLRDLQTSRFFNDSKGMTSFESVVRNFLKVPYCDGLGLHCATTNADMAMRLYLKHKDLSLKDWNNKVEEEEEPYENLRKYFP